MSDIRKAYTKEDNARWKEKVITTAVTFTLAGLFAVSSFAQFSRTTDNDKSNEIKHRLSEQPQRQPAYVQAKLQ